MKKKKWFLRKRFLFPIIYVVELAVFLTIAQIFGFGETEPLPDGDFPTILYTTICLSIIFLTIFGFIIKIIQDYKEKYPWIKLLYFFIAFCILCAIPSFLFAFGVIEFPKEEQSVSILKKALNDDELSYMVVREEEYEGQRAHVIKAFYNENTHITTKGTYLVLMNTCEIYEMNMFGEGYIKIEHPIVF
ncbi:MAG: hypothetical protein FWH05_01220 [Oscillospiraceae bacterium]|nr:hypothetical protein [Oscillospiraceae bacterium]